MKKKTNIWLSPFILMGIILILTNSCKKKDEISNPAQIPVITTTPITNITQTNAKSGGDITEDFGLTITACGVCWSTNPNPTIIDGITTEGTDALSFTSSITGLTSNTTYYVRAYATNINGTGYGNEISFTTLKEVSGTVTDRDGNLYHFLTIGTQVWMVENLKTTRYRDGLSISYITDEYDWSVLTTAGYCWYSNNAATYKNTYGALYNWYAAADSRLCPTGWHVPSSTELKTLSDFLGGANAAGGKLKETGIIHWSDPNYGATDETHFTALPGGRRDDHGIYSDIGLNGNWWTSTSYISDPTIAWNYSMHYSDVMLTSNMLVSKLNGFSIRCIRD